MMLKAVASVHSKSCSNNGFPENWGKVKIGDLCLKGKQTNPKNNPNDNFHYIDVSSVSNESFKIEKPQSLLGKEAPSRARRIINKNDVLYATVRPYLKRIAIVPESLDGQIASTGFCVLKINEKLADPEFIYFFLLTDDFNKRVKEFQTGSSYPAVSDRDVFEQQIALPPLPEQKAIARVLSTIQQAISAQDRIIELTRELKKALMQKLFSEGINGSKKNWKSMLFGDFATLQRGKDLPIQKRRPGAYPIIGSNGICGTHDEYVDLGPGVATGRSGTLGGSFYIEGPFWPLNTALWVKDFHGNEPLFVHYFLQNFDFRQFKSGVSVPTLNRNLVHSTKIQIPERKEQIFIAQFLRSFDQKIQVAKNKRILLDEKFKACLNSLMTGEIRAGKKYEIIK